MSNSATRLGLRNGLFDRNLSILTIPVAFAMAFLPHTAKVIALGERFDNVKPRQSGQNYKSTDDSVYREKMSRLEAMHINGMESFPLFAAAVLAANFSRLSTRTINIFSLSYLATRVAYNAFYYTQSSNTGANLRSASYFAGMLSSLWVLVQSGNSVRELL